MKLYYAKGACSLTIRIIAHEMGVKLDYEHVDIHHSPKKTASGKDYLNIAPKGNVPALQLDNGEILTENVAILEYLADTHPSPLLPPIPNMKRYRVLEWLSFMCSDMHKAFSPIFSSQVPDDLKQSVFIPILKNRLETIDKNLDGKTFLTGETFTLPDAYCFVMLRWLTVFKMTLDEYPNVQRFFDSVASRPAVKEALEEEG